MAKQTKTTDQKIINSGAMHYLMHFPAAGRLLRMTSEGSGVVASIADDLGRQSNDAVPFMLACRSLRVERTQSKEQAHMWFGALEHVLPFPPEGRLIRVTANGADLVASVADDLGRSEDAIPFTYAFSSMCVEPVLDPDAPFNPYNPGVVCGN
ncbi:MAG: hypothetical protein EHM80_14315 [Nitrospiraceae bacterium]|nr:MAG: hypothetical protein EHM80_14315 [Nitrospiraceae bacterium]